MIKFQSVTIQRENIKRKKQSACQKKVRYKKNGNGKSDTLKL